MIHGLLALAAVGGAPEVAVEPTAGPPWVEMVWSWTTDLDPAAQTGRTSAAAEVLFARADALSDLAGTVAVDARHGRIVLTAGAPADRWPTILPMLAERLFAASVSEQEANAALARAQRIRRATRYDDVALARQAVRADLFGGTLLARPAVGTARGLAAITEDDLASFLRRTFTRDRVRLDLRGPISRKFTWPGANLPTGTAPPPPTMPPPQKGTRLILVDKPSARSAIVGVGRWPVEGVPAVCQLGIRVEAMGHQRTFAWAPNDADSPRRRRRGAARAAERPRRCRVPSGSSRRDRPRARRFVGDRRSNAGRGHRDRGRRESRTGGRSPARHRRRFDPSV